MCADEEPPPAAAPRLENDTVMRSMPQRRLRPLDAFRGLTIAAMVLVNNPGTWAAVYAPLTHARWHGLTPTDVIFPFFLFIVGVAIPLSRPTVGRVLRRAAIIFALGLVLNGLPRFDWATIRIPGVPQRSAASSCLSARLFLRAASTRDHRRLGAGRRARRRARRGVGRLVPGEQSAVDQLLRGADRGARAARVRGVLLGHRGPRLAAVGRPLRRPRRQRAGALL